MEILFWWILFCDKDTLPKGITHVQLGKCCWQADGSPARIMAALRTINFIPKGDCKEQKVKMDCKRDRLYNLWESVQNENGGSPCSNTITHFMTVTAEVAAQAAQPRSWPWPQRMWLGTRSVQTFSLSWTPSTYGGGLNLIHTAWNPTALDANRLWLCTNYFLSQTLGILIYKRGKEQPIHWATIWVNWENLHKGLWTEPVPEYELSNSCL